MYLVSLFDLIFLFYIYIKNLYCRVYFLKCKNDIKFFFNFKRFNLTKTFTWTKGMSILIWNMKHKRHMVLLIGYFD
jgi:hypothetical protein